jgi:MFS family permease
MLGYFANWGTSLHIDPSSAKQWINPTTMHIIFAGIILIATFFAVESPRYLCKKGDFEKAALVMTKLRMLPVKHFYVQAELIDIKDQVDREQEATLGTNWLGALRELFTMKSNLYRFMLGFMAQLLGQWSGGGSITIYAPQFFAILGTTGQSEKLFATAIFGVVKFVSALICAFFLVDFLGRKRALSIGNHPTIHLGPLRRHLSYSSPADYEDQYQDGCLSPTHRNG